MSEWKEYCFSDAIEICPTVSLKGTDSYSFVEMKDLSDGNRYCYPSIERKLSGGSRFQDRDTLFARITPCLENGKICQVIGLKNGVGFGSTEFLVFQGKKEITDNDFVFYLSRSEEVRSFAEQNFDGTSGRQRVPKSTFDNLAILLPPLPEQRAIAGVLSSLDDKIDLLRRQNKTLEGMAEALWRKMFVEEADPGWKKGKLGDEMDITMGQSPPGNTYNEENQGMLFFQGRAEFGFRFPEARLYCIEPKRFAKRCDTLVSVRAPVGDINMASEECCIGRGLAAVKHKKEFVSYTFYKIRSLRDDFDSFEQQGTVFGSIGKDDFNGIDTIIPDIKIGLFSHFLRYRQR